MKTPTLLAFQSRTRKETNMERLLSIEITWQRETIALPGGQYQE